MLVPPPALHLQVSIRSTTLCGSDLHYYNHFRNGDIIVREPLSLGHESSGIVTAVGAGLDGQWAIGDRVALEVGVPCDACEACKSGRYNICSTLRFRGSAKSNPHYWGTLQEKINHPAKWCHKLPASVSYKLGSLIEPLSVAIHATRKTRRNESLKPGCRVLVLGAGAVGLMVGAMCKLSGASRVIISDINVGRVDFAIANGFATHAHHPCVPLQPPESVDDKLALAKESANAAADIAGGEVDVTFECTGMEICVQTGIYATRPGGTLLLLGMGVPIQTLPISAAALREVDILGGFRYANTYKDGIEIAASGMIPGLEKIITHRFVGIDAVREAFEIAGRQKDDEGNLVIKVECAFPERTSPLEE